MNDELKTKILAKDKWLRIVFMVIFSIIMWFAWWVYIFIILFQFIFTLFTDKTNEVTTEFSQKLNTYIYQILCYLTYNTEMKPFPFSPWPKEIKAIQIEKE